MAPIDIQVRRSKVSVEWQAYTACVGERGGGALVFYKQVYICWLYHPRLHLRKFIALIAVAEGWLLVDNGFVLLPSKPGTKNQMKRENKLI